MRQGHGRRRVAVNESFAMQRVTGQQRYATEVAKRLVDLDGFQAARPGGFWAASAIRTWLWVTAVLPLAERSSVVLSMTARAPVWQRRHVLVVHDLFVLTNPEWFSKRYYWTHAPLLRFQLRTAAALVAVSQPVADDLAASYQALVRVAPNAPSEVFRCADAGGGDTERALADRGLVAGSYFLTVGSMDPRKNLPLLARAYAGLSEDERRAHPLVVVGGGSAVFRSEDIAWPAEVLDAGYVTDDELRQLYRGARAVVFVSKAEGFGLPLVEAAAAGTACLVISDIPVFRWVCGDGAHYVDPADESSIRAGLRAALEAQQPPQVDLSRFDWDTTAAVVRNVCSALA